MYLYLVFQCETETMKETEKVKKGKKLYNLG
jgi:hypothetical protein